MDAEELGALLPGTGPDKALGYTGKESHEAESLEQVPWNSMCCRTQRHHGSASAGVTVVIQFGTAADIMGYLASPASAH